jgi:hypothetical protein
VTHFVVLGHIYWKEMSITQTSRFGKIKHFLLIQTQKLVLLAYQPAGAKEQQNLYPIHHEIDYYFLFIKEIYKAVHENFMLFSCSISTPGRNSWIYNRLFKLIKQVIRFAIFVWCCCVVQYRLFRVLFVIEYCSPGFIILINIEPRTECQL